MTEKTRRRMRTGLVVFSALALIKITEYALARLVSKGAWPYLLVLAVASVWLIAYYYKHIHQLWRGGGHDGE